MGLCGMTFFGWKAVSCVILTACAATVSHFVVAALLKKRQPDRPIESLSHVVANGLLLGLCLPLMSRSLMNLLGGVLLGVAGHGIGRSHRVRAHPIALVMILTCLIPEIYSCFDPGTPQSRLGTPTATVLTPDRVLVGDAFDIAKPPHWPIWSWWHETNRNHDAIKRTDPYVYWLAHQNQILRLDSQQAGDELSCLELCGMDELLLGSVPGPIGGSSRALLIVLGMILICRRLSWWPCVLTAFVTWLGLLMLMPVWFDDPSRSIVLIRLIDQGLIIAIVYLGYAMLTSPWPLIVMVLAPVTSPMSKKGKLVYGAILGGGLVLTQWFIALPSGAYLSLGLASLLSRPLDRLHTGPLCAHWKREATVSVSK